MFPPRKRHAPAGGRIRSSCGYHHQRHQACPEDCLGRRNHPPTEHVPIRDKFAVGCPPCQSFFTEELLLASPVAPARVPSRESTPSASSPSPSPPVSPPPPSCITERWQFGAPRTFCVDDFRPRMQLPPLSSSSSCSSSSPPSQRVPHQQPSSPPPKLAHEEEAENLHHHRRRHYDEEHRKLLAELASLEEKKRRVEELRRRVQQQQAILIYQKELQEAEMMQIALQRAALEEQKKQIEKERLELAAVQQQVEMERVAAAASATPAVPPPAAVDAPQGCHSPTMVPEKKRPHSDDDFDDDDDSAPPGAKRPLTDSEVSDHSPKLEHGNAPGSL